jgi:flagellar protein FlaG
MDISANKPVSSVAPAPVERGRTAASQANVNGSVSAAAEVATESPPQKVTTPTPRIDAELAEDQKDRAAALARRMNDFLRSVSRDVEFQVDAESGDAVITVRDSAGNIVRKIPGEEALQMLRRNNVESGTLIDSIV